MSAFDQDEYDHTAALLRSGNEAVVSATLSNNLNIILAALDATKEAAKAEAAAEIERLRARIVELEAGKRVLKGRVV